MNTLSLRIQKIWTKTVQIFRPSMHILTLGRWHLTECPKTIDRKVDWANEDHCGPCGSNPIKVHSKSSKLSV